MSLNGPSDHLRVLNDRTVISVPASSANLGPGYDCLAVALPLRLTVTLERRPGPLAITLAGEGSLVLPADETNLVVATMTELAGPPRDLAIHIDNEIPLRAGAGSSSAAIVAGLAAGCLLAGKPVDPAVLLELAVPLEGHPDNAAAAIYGGVTIALDGDSPLARRIEPPEDLAFVLAVPAVQLCTKESRRALRPEVARADAVHNVQHVALLVHALIGGDLALLPRALHDRLHQPDRAPLTPLYSELAAAELSALGVTLSGAGPSVLVWTSRADGPAVFERVRALAGDARVLLLAPERAGVLVSAG